LAENNLTPMRSLGSYLLRSRIHAIAVVSLTAVLSFYVSSIMIALVVMRRGGGFGMQVIGGAVALVLLASVLIHAASAQTVLLNALQAWLPVWCCAMVLRRTESQAVMALLAGAFGAIFVVLIYMLVDDVPVWWQDWFSDLVDIVFADGLTGETAARIDQLKADLARIAPVINPLIVSFLMVRLITVILIGRWWQSRLFNPGGFRKEFYALQLPRPLLYPAFIGVAVMLIGDVSKLMPIRDVLWLLIILYLFQGLSSVHRLVRGREYSQLWLVAMYGLLVIVFPHMIVLVACLGMADSWMRGKNPVNG
jgi:hypothetical protein